mgnify:CR=1 FL=1
MPILFLDSDGVLHPEHCHESKHFCLLPVLENVVRQVPEVGLVITSTWRLQFSLDELRYEYPAELVPEGIKLNTEVNVLRQKGGLVDVEGMGSLVCRHIAVDDGI